MLSPVKEHAKLATITRIIPAKVKKARNNIEQITVPQNHRNLALADRTQLLNENRTP